MSPEERGYAVVTARLLKAVAPVTWLASALLVVSVIKRAPFAGILGLIAVVYGVRVAFDARLFDDILNERITTEQMDAALGAKRSRDWIDRSRGARKLVIKAAIATTLVVVVLLYESHSA